MSCRVQPAWVVALFLCLAWMSGQILGCSSNEPRYPQDHARYERIDRAVESLRKAYVQKDLSSIQALLLPMDSLDRMEQEVQNDFQTFQDISLEFSIERILIEAETIEVYVHWQGQWTRTPAEAGVRERGHGMFRWEGVQSILLKGVEGDLPFGMATRHTVPSTSRPGAVR
jgi:hypothetical protein